MDVLVGHGCAVDSSVDSVQVQGEGALTRGELSAVGVGVVVFLASAVLLAVEGPVLANAQTVCNGTFVLAGLLLVVRRPGHRLGPVLMLSGIGFELLFAVDALSQGLAADGRGVTASWVAWAFAWLLHPTSWLTCALILIFPKGRADGRWSRRLVWAMAAVAAILVPTAFFVPPALLPQRFDDPFPHPFLDADVADSVNAWFRPLGVLLPLGALIGTVIAVGRLRRSEGVERRQNEWLVFALAVYIPLSFYNVLVDPLGHVAGGSDFVDAIGFILIPIAVLIAVMRYRLYEIDRIVTKSVVYVGLVASATIVYAGIVVVPILVLGESDGEGVPGLLLPIVATAVVALLFEPLRRRLVNGANRLVYGRRSTPHDVLSALTEQLAESETADNLDELAALLGAGTGAEAVTIWRLDGHGRTVDGHWSREGVDAAPATFADDARAADDTVASAPVRHGGHELGVVVIRKAPDDPVSRVDRELLDDVAGGAGLVMRNVGLNRELERRAVEVRESRRRLIAAQDAERHRLERDLHDGAQQEIVALKVKLGLAQAIATREGAEDLAARIHKLAISTQDAVDAVRAVAHGIYPPLLEAEGLGPALASLVRTAPIPLRVHVEVDHRLPRPLEETIYFCVLGMLHGAHDAGATSVSAAVSVGDGPDSLVVTLGHDGPAFDVTPIIDRVEAASGIVEATDRGAMACRLPLPAVLADEAVASA